MESSLRSPLEGEERGLRRLNAVTRVFIREERRSPIDERRTAAGRCQARGAAADERLRGERPRSSTIDFACRAGAVCWSEAAPSDRAECVESIVSEDAPEEMMRLL